MISRIIQIIKGFSSLFLFVAFICNIALSFFSYRSIRNSSSVVVTNYVELVAFPSSNTTSLVSAPIKYKDGFSSFTNVASTSTTVQEAIKKEVAQTYYQYFLVGHRIGVFMFDRFYYEGSLCSWGRIKYLFPDRIILEDGNWITNTKHFDYSNDERKQRDDGRAV